MTTLFQILWIFYGCNTEYTICSIKPPTMYVCYTKNVWPYKQHEWENVTVINTGECKLT
jgi:hypothetical protein